MQSPVVESTETPEIRWPIPRDPRALDPAEEMAEAQDTRLPTRRPPLRAAREQRGARLRWGLLWLSALFGGISAWAWLARQDQVKIAHFAVERELNEIALLRSDLERAPELKPGSLRIYVEKIEARQAPLNKRLAGLPAESPLHQLWKAELQTYGEAKADLDWLQPRWLQLGVMEGARLTDEIKANEASLRPVLERFAHASTCGAPCPGARFRPGLARGLLVELDRRMNEVRAAAAASALPQFPPDRPMVLEAQKARPAAPALKQAKAAKKPAAKAPVKLAAKAPVAKSSKRLSILAKDRPKSTRDLTHRHVRVAARDDSGEEIIRATRSLRQRR